MVSLQKFKNFGTILNRNMKIDTPVKCIIVCNERDLIYFEKYFIEWNNIN